MLMTGKIGSSAIVNEDINRFFSAIKDIDWTDNNIYKPAKICEVKPTFEVNSNQSSYSQAFQSKSGLFDQFIIEDNSNHLSDFQAYKSDIDDRMAKNLEKINTQKKDFILNILNTDGVDENSDKHTILEAIRINMVKIITNTKLKEKLGNYVNSLDNSNQFNNVNSNNMNFNNQQLGSGNNYNNAGVNNQFGNQGAMNNPAMFQGQYSNNYNNMNNNMNNNNNYNNNYQYSNQFK